MKHAYLIYIILVFLQACANEENLKDLEKFTSHQENARDVNIQPLPTINPTEFFQYSAAHKISPFELNNVIHNEPTSLQIDPVLPGQDRRRQTLEYFALDSLEMVGSLEQNGQVFALIFAPDKTIHRIHKDDFMGTHLGKVIEITESEVVLKETIKTTQGHWEKRNTSITLNEQ